jgi:two-component system CheB/CheR fusion protein
LNLGTRLQKSWIIGVGASAGGLEALTLFVSNLPRSFNGTVIIAQHLAPHSKSMMVELLQKSSMLPVRQAEHELQVEKETIYVVPPNFDVSVKDGVISLKEAEEAIRPKPSIDEFFSSLAQNYREYAAGIILSGTGTDGSKGIEAIKRAGGLTLAQDDRSAKYDGMPKAAVATGSVDTILPPEQIARNLSQYLIDHESQFRAQRLNPEGLQQIFTIIRDQLGQDFTQYKPPTIRRRIAKRMMAVRKETFEDYYELLKQKPGEIGELGKELLISVTSLFRDPEVWEALRDQLLEILEKHRSGEEYRVWVAGCATGEEAYTIAMIALDVQGQLNRQFPIKIFATDLDQDALQEARLGLYMERDLATVPGPYRDRFFDQKSDTTFELVKRVRELVVFARQDLIQNPPFVKLNLISCRNVMIYFDIDLQKKVLEIFHYALGREGILLIGKSETTAATPQLFDPIEKKMKLYERRDVATQSIPMGRASRSRVQDMPSFSKRPSSLENVGQLAQRQLNRVFEVAGAVVDEDGGLVQVFGDVSPFLKLSETLLNLKISNLLPKSVGIEIPILIRKTLKDKAPHRSRTFKVGKGSSAISFQIVVQPLSAEGDDRVIERFFLLSFETKKAAAVIAPIEITGEMALENDLPHRLAEVEQELHITREHLQTVIEELGVSNEELQSLNEELSSTNEELQASNEELETTNEEMQSSNEELTTVNEELTAKSSELKALSVNLENIQNSIGSPLLILDSRLRLVRYNADALKVFFITPSDMGREISALSTVCEIPDFERLAQLTLETGKATEATCEAAGLNYQVRIQASLDENRKTVGLILVFTDHTQMIRTQEKLRASESRIRAIIDESPTLISLKDNLGRYQLVNEAYMRFYGITESIIGKTDREVLPELIANQMRDNDLEVFIKRSAVRKQESVQTPDGPRVILATRFPIMDTTGMNPVAVGTISLDTTAQVDASRALEQSESRYKAIVEDQAVFVCRHQIDGTLLFTNETFALYFGSTAAKKKTFFECIDSEDREGAKRVLSSLSPSRPVAQHEHRVTRWDEGTRWIRWIHRGVFGTTGELIEYQSVGFDVTEYRKQTDALRDRDSIFNSIFANTSDFISVFRAVDGELRLESLNRSAEQTLGHAVTQLIGRPLRDFFSAQSSDQALERYERVIETGEAELFEEEVAMAGSTRFYSTTIVPIFNDAGRVDRVAAMSRDVTSYKEIAHDLMRARDSAEVANRAKSDFLASMSHELRTPLNVVLGLCQMLELSKLEPDQVNYVNGIHRSGKLLLTLIEDVLDISKIEAGKVKLESVSFRLRDLVDDILLLFMPQAREKGISLTTEFDIDGSQNFIGDPARIRQILLNFISNALKFTSEGSVVVRVSQKNNQAVSLSVVDTGIGIRSDDHAKIFQKFSQAESGHTRRFGGTGLGLAISKQLANLMGGEVGFRSEMGRGSTFWCELPLKRTTNDAVPISSHSTNPVAQRSQLRVLAVDDNADSRIVIGLFLKKLGHHFEVAESGRQAIEKVASGAFDLILMDMQMPEMDGCETTIELRKMPKSARTPIIALTANALKQDVDRCFECGMDDYLSKPLRIDDLSALLNKWTEEIELNGRGQPTQ